jgi:hypothetical protein
LRARNFSSVVNDAVMLSTKKSSQSIRFATTFHRNFFPYGIFPPGHSCPGS